jgi:ribosomal protein S18 acetylase RimI-like enzyme
VRAERGQIAAVKFLLLSMLTRLAITEDDVEELASLKPPDWDDIRPGLRFYLSSPSGKAWKFLIGSEVAGIGASLTHQYSAWLGHIIVHPDFRGKGFGTEITKSLLNDLAHIPTVLLIATPAGKFVYDKLGFVQETDYVFYKGGEAGTDTNIEMVPLDEKHVEQVLQLDREVTGEGRHELLQRNLAQGLVHLEDGRVDGFYLPVLGEGLIISRTEKAGLALLERKLAVMQRAVVMEDNTAAIRLLKSKGYSEVKRGTRMRLGKQVKYSPQCLYNRISGGLG